MASKGILVDYEWCTGCQTCVVACQMELGLPPDEFGVMLLETGPYKYGPEKENWQLAYVPVFTNQCNLCADRLEKGKLPSCVHHCQAKCLTYGTLEELSEKLSDKTKQTLFCLA